MDSNFQALFTHFKPTDDQVKAAFQDLWIKNYEKQKEIDGKQKAIDEQDRKINELSNKLELSKSYRSGYNMSCPVCLEKFDIGDHQAYVLSCPHMVCSK